MIKQRKYYDQDPCKKVDYCYKVDKCSKNVETTSANVSTIKCHIASSRKSTDITCLLIDLTGLESVRDIP